MIAIATGIDMLDEQLHKNLCDGKQDNRIVNYREFFLKEDFSVVILSKRLKGDLELEQLLYYLKSKNSRIIFLTDQSNTQEIYLCFKYGIYDMVFDPITAENIVNSLNHIQFFSNHTKLFANVMNGERINNEKRAVLKEVMGKSTSSSCNEKGSLELERIKQLRAKEKAKFEKDIKELQKKLEEEASKPTVIKFRERTIKQQIIAFWTVNNNFLKEKIVVNLALLLEKKSTHKILIIDFDEESTIKEILNINVENKLNLAAQNDYNNEKSIKEKIRTVKDFDNLRILDAFNEGIQRKEFINIVGWAKDNYDTIMINLNCKLMDEERQIINKSNYLMVVLEGILPIIKAAKRKLVEIRNQLGNEKIKLILADMNQYRLREFKRIIESEVISWINYEEIESRYINEGKYFILSKEGKKGVNNYCKVLEYLGYIPKMGLLRRIINRLC